MSEDNVEVLRRVYDALSRRDLEALGELSEPGVQWETMEELVGPGLMRGREQITAFLEEWWATFDVMSMELDEVLLAKGDHVVAAVRVQARARQSGVATEMRYVQSAIVRGGRLVELRDYADPRDALQAAVLRE